MKHRVYKWIQMGWVSLVVGIEHFMVLIIRKESEFKYDCIDNDNKLKNQGTTMVTSTSENSSLQLI